MPKDTFLEILINLPTKQILTERTFHLEDYRPFELNFSHVIKVKTPWMPENHMVNRIEIVVRIFEDSSRGKLFGEHHQFINIVGS